jgi:hypothetical protein
MPPFLDCYRTKIAYEFYLLAVGTNSGRGLSEILNELGSNVTAPQSYYETARIYNSGSIAPSGNLEDSVTRCYASDIANRLLGWAFAPQASSCVS